MREGWKTKTFAEAGTWSGGGTPAKSKKEFWSGGSIPWVSPKDMKSMYVDDTIDSITPSAVDGSSAKYIDGGSVLFVTRSGILRRTLPIGINRDTVTVNQDIKAFTPEDILPEYAYYFAKSVSEEIRRTCAKDGTTVESIDTRKLYDFSISYPPLPEQRAIVAKLEELLGALDRSVGELEVARGKLGVYRQSVLKEAFGGRLTEGWREENEVPSAKSIMVKVRNQDEALCKNKFVLWEANKTAVKKPKKPKPLSIPNTFNEETPYDYWAAAGIDWFLSRTRKGMTTGPFGTALKKSEHKTEGLPVLGIENIGEGIFQKDNKIFITPEKAKELDSFKVEEGDVIISRSGTVGEICTVPKLSKQAYISTNLIRVSLNDSVISSKYFVYLFQGGRVRKQVKDLCVGSTRDFLNQKILKNITFPLPSLPEQHQIVAEIESRLSVADAMEREIAAALERAKGLRMGVLGRAFGGELV